MSKRTEQVESIVRQTVASALRERMAAGAANVTVTAVDVAPDLKTGVVWIGVIGEEPEAVMAEIAEVRAEVQTAVAKQMTTKFVPRLSFKLDTGGEYAEKIKDLLKDL